MKPLKPSVSKIVSEIFPTDPHMFQDALNSDALEKKLLKWELINWGIAFKSKYLDANSVMDSLTSFGTHIHSIAFDKGILGIEYPQLPLFQNHVKELYRFFQENNFKMIYWEKHIETDEYTGTVDAVFQQNWLNYAVDFKTWTAYKYLYGFQNNILKKNGQPYSRSSDIKKVSLQLSLYKDWLEAAWIPIHWLKVIWITEQWLFVFDCNYDISLYEQWKKNKILPPIHL